MCYKLHVIEYNKPHSITAAEKHMGAPPTAKVIGNVNKQEISFHKYINVTYIRINLSGQNWSKRWRKKYMYLEIRVLKRR